MGRTIKGLQERRSYKIAKNGLPQFTSNFQGWGGTNKKVAEAKPSEEKAEEASAGVEPVAERGPVVELGEILTRPIVPVARKMEESPKAVAPAPPMRMDVQMEAEEAWAAMITTAATPPIIAPPAPTRVDRSAPAPEGPSASASRKSVWGLLLRKLTFCRPPVKVRTVQTELALERVAVVRNDLSDDDLEVRPSKAAKERNPFKTGAKSRRMKEAKEEEEAAEPELMTAAPQP